MLTKVGIFRTTSHLYLLSIWFDLVAFDGRAFAIDVAGGQ